VRSNQKAYAELGLKASSMLASVANTLQKADAARITSISANLDTLIRYVVHGNPRQTNLESDHCRVITEVGEAVNARITSANKRSKFRRFAKQIFEAKEETDAIRGLDMKIQNVVSEFHVRIIVALTPFHICSDALVQLSSNIRLELYDYDILRTVTRLEDSLQRLQISAENRATDADNGELWAKAGHT
jgi:hypothetical protein